MRPQGGRDVEVEEEEEEENEEEEEEEGVEEEEVEEVHMGHHSRDCNQGLGKPRDLLQGLSHQKDQRNNPCHNLERTLRCTNLHMEGEREHFLEALGEMILLCLLLCLKQ